ncbi:hypothetical protein [Nesterenkonia muleiensis]|uniref:hypothetical protein n=1 Tax=Nesterenkonia muleiensis TaxID=2282648 RepID=UPI000E72DD27|nr:hypothetical protein [Nesterenkonia muleiensis]
MRFVYAIIAFLLGLVLLGLGITQLTAETEETYTVETEGAQEAPFTVITDDVIDAEDGRDEFTIEAEGEYLIALGRTYDVEAWLDDAAHNRLTGFEPSDDPDQPSRFVAEFIDGETDVPDPSTSDLWVSVETAEGEMPYRWDTPDEAGDWALLIYREDDEPAPAAITTTETVTLSAVGGIALTVIGALLILLALGLFYRALSAPRRKKDDAAAASAAVQPAAAEEAETAEEAEPAEQREADSDHERPAQQAAAWTVPSAEAAVEEDEDAPTALVPVYAEEPAEQDADAGSEDDASGSNTGDSDSGEAKDEVREDDQDDDEDEDGPLTTGDTPEQTNAETGEKLSGWAKGLRDRLGGGKSPFAVALAMLVALASAFGPAGPAHAEDEQDESEADTEQTDEDADGAEDGDDDADGEPEDSDEETDDSEGGGEQTDEAEEPEDQDGEQDEAPDELDAEELDEEGAEPGVEGEMPSEGYSVLLSSQLDRILEDIAETVDSGDEEQDAELLEDRVGGKALEYRELAYRNYDLAETSLPAPIGTDVLSAAVSGDPEFPRQAVVIVEHPDTEVPQILVLEQTSARENYKLVHTAMMAPGTEFPAFSPEQGGVSVADPGDAEAEDSPAATLGGIANWFADDGHEFGDQMAESAYIEELHEYHQALNEDADDTEIEIPSPEVDYEEISAVELPDGTVVVAGAFDISLQMSPISDGDTIFLEHDLVEELLGTDWTTFPTQITSQEFVVAQIPPEDSEEEIVLLGVDNLISDASIDTPDWFDGY